MVEKQVDNLKDFAVNLWCKYLYNSSSPIPSTQQELSTAVTPKDLSK